MAYLALYRLYRPTTFEQIVGQQAITRTLQNQVSQDRIGHAYLFCGARGTGKTSTAKVFARAINCKTPNDGQPCASCDICTMSDADLSMDIVEIDAASNNGVDEIRDLRDKVKFAPAVCKYRVYIIDEVHMLSTGAFNALLKTLEEPPAHAVFILATTEAHKLPATILSRCQRFDFRRIPIPVLTEQLNMVLQKQGVTADERAVAAIAKAAEGGMRDALSLLDQCIGYAGNTLSYEDVLMILGATSDDMLNAMAQAVADRDVHTAMDLLQQTYDDGKDMLVFARDLTERFAAIMVDQADKKQDATAAMQAVSVLSQAEGQMRYSMRPRVNLQSAIVRLCMDEDSTPTVKAPPRASTQPERQPKQPEQQQAQAQIKQQEQAKPGMEQKETVLQQPAQAAIEPLQQAPTPQPPAAPVVAEGQMDAKQVFDAMLDVLKQTNPAVVRLMRFGKPRSYADGMLTVAFSKEDGIIVDGMKKQGNADDISAAISMATGNNESRIAYQVGEQLQQGVADNEQDLIKRAEAAFGMPVEIED